MEPTLEKAIDHFGPEHQILKCIEEFSELNTVLAKYLNGEGLLINIVDEICDAENMLTQLKHIFNCHDLVASRKKYKLERLEKKIEIQQEERLLEREPIGLREPEIDTREPKEHPHSQTMPFLDEG